MKSRTLKIVIILFAMLLGCLFAFLIFNSNNIANSNNIDNNASQANNNVIVFDGNNYIYNHNITNILFLGIDKEEEVVINDSPGRGGQADSIILLSMNHESKTVDLLQISRDTMTDVDIYDANGNYLTSVIAQIATQYAYGNGADTSAWAMKKTVSELLYELPIDGYLSLNIEGVPFLNDAVGGVTLTIPQDYTYINPLFENGKEVTLDGELAERYIRYRDINEIGSNNERMLRQRQYIPALLSQIKNISGDFEEIYDTLYSSVSDYLVTDLTAQHFEKLFEYEWNVDNIQLIDGEIVVGEEHEEFHVDNKKLQKKVIEMFYKLK